MRKVPLLPLLIGFAAIAVLAGVMMAVMYTKKDVSQAQGGQEIIYHCPMHPTYLSHKPGTCPICGMKLVPVNGSAPQNAGEKKRVLFYRDAMNPSYTSDKPGKATDGMDLVAVYEGEDNGNGIKIDPAMIQSIGVRTEKAEIRTLTRDIRTSATVMPDERRVSSITTKVMGYVEKLYVNYTGQRVKKGQPLYDVYSPDLVSAQTEYLQTFQNSAFKDLGQLRQSSRQRLLNWDVTEEQIAALEKRGGPEKTMTVVSPVQGTVAEKMIVEGQTIEPGMQLYKVIDYSRVWVEGAIYQQDVPLVKLGQQVPVELDYYPGERFLGKVTYISPELDRESRTLMVRLELANTPDIKIKPGMNASITIHSVMNRKSVTVPDEAVIHSGLRTLVVVAKGGGYFEPREITIGQTAGGYTEVLSGVREGEEIVVSSQFLIDSESKLKAAVMQMAGKKETTGTAPDENRPVQDSAVKGRGTMPEMKYEKPAATHKLNDNPKTLPKQLYTCPMHPEVISDKPGSCPKCGMNLVPKKPEAERKNAAPDTVSGMENMPGMERTEHD
jgi:Cu(I)/Ag(I) efflux system membrane fusion protein